MSTKVVITQAETIHEEVEAMRDQVRARAGELSRTSARHNPEEDWRNAERELLYEAPIEVRKMDDRFEIVAAIAGVPAVNIQVTQDAVLFKGDGSHACKDDEAVRLCDFSRGQLFRWVQFGERIDSLKASADCRNGLLHFVAPLYREEVVAPPKAKRAKAPATTSTRRTRSKGN